MATKSNSSNGFNILLFFFGHLRMFLFSFFKCLQHIKQIISDKVIVNIKINKVKKTCFSQYERFICKPTEFFLKEHCIRDI